MLNQMKNAGLFVMLIFRRKGFGKSACFLLAGLTKEVVLMKKRIRDIVIAVVVLAIICVVFWNIEWISSWKEIALLYGLLAIVITISIVTDAIKKKFVK